MAVCNKSLSPGTGKYLHTVVLPDSMMIKNLLQEQAKKNFDPRDVGDAQ